VNIPIVYTTSVIKSSCWVIKVKPDKNLLLITDIQRSPFEWLHFKSPIWVRFNAIIVYIADSKLLMPPGDQGNSSARKSRRKLFTQNQEEVFEDIGDVRNLIYMCLINIILSLCHVKVFNSLKFPWKNF
jgi:hypothetical protein